MVDSQIGQASDAQVRALAEFRFTLRRFLHFSEEAATRVGLTPQQHQLMLQVAAAHEETVPDIGYLAARLSLRHNSVVELSKRCEEAGLVVRTSNPDDHRHVVLTLTPAGNQTLRELSADHFRELNELGPRLIQDLQRLTA
jgi:DNA-binding MarR family transcriptional regulator